MALPELNGIIPMNSGNNRAPATPNWASERTVGGANTQNQFSPVASRKLPTKAVLERPYAAPASYLSGDHRELMMEVLEHVQNLESGQQEILENIKSLSKGKDPKAITASRQVRPQASEERAPLPHNSSGQLSLNSSSYALVQRQGASDSSLKDSTPKKVARSGGDAGEGDETPLGQSLGDRSHEVSPAGHLAAQEAARTQGLPAQLDTRVPITEVMTDQAPSMGQAQSHSRNVVFVTLESSDEGSDEDIIWEDHNSENAENELEWPATLQPRHLASEEPKEGFKQAGSMITLLSRRRPSIGHSSSQPGLDQIFTDLDRRKADVQPASSHLIIEPHSPRVLWFDAIGCIVLLYDIMIPPFAVAMDLPTIQTFVVCAWSTGLYWTIDLFIGFFRGYYHQGDLVLTQPKVAWHYLLHWFPIDIGLLALDWTHTVLSTWDLYPESEQGARVLKMAKVMRILKALRISRLARLFSKVSQKVKREQTHVALQIFKVTIATILVSHLLSCIFLLIGRDGLTDTGLRWPAANAVGGLPIEEAGYTYRYCSALHWTLAQMTLGANEIIPVNSWERLFTTLLLIFGLLFGSVLVSFFSAQVMHLIMLRREMTFNIIALKKFLRQRGVTRGLTERIQRQIEERSQMEMPLKASQVPVLSLISNSLNVELVRETILPFVLTHHLLESWSFVSAEAVNVFCCEAVGHHFAAQGDDLFLPLHRCEAAFAPLEGTLKYIQMPEWSKVRVAREQLVEVQSQSPNAPWLCEVALWTQWVHVGRCEALTQCTMLKVDAASIENLVSQYPYVYEVTRQYAHDYHERVVNAHPPLADYPTDLCVPFTTPEALLSQVLGITRVKDGVTSGSITEVQAMRIIAELDVLDCALRRNPNGGLSRVLNVIDLHITNQQGRLFVILAKLVEDKLVQEVQVALPGYFRGHGTLPLASLKSYLTQELPAFKGSLGIVGIARDKKESESSWPFAKLKERQLEEIGTIFECTEFVMEVVNSGPALPLVGEIDLGDGPHDVHKVQTFHKDKDRSNRAHDETYLCAWIDSIDFEKWQDLAASGWLLDRLQTLAATATSSAGENQLVAVPSAHLQVEASSSDLVQPTTSLLQL